MVSTGSGSPFAYGVLESQYEEEATVDEMISIVVKAVDSAMKRDVASGDSFDVAVIDDSGFKELSPEEKAGILNN
jgi:proteasome beta subunit